MATPAPPLPRPSILTWRLPWTDEHEGLQSMRRTELDNSLAGAHPASAVLSLPPARTSVNSCDLTYYNPLTDFPTVGTCFRSCYYERSDNKHPCISFVNIESTGFTFSLVFGNAGLSFSPSTRWGRVTTCDFNLRSLVT